MIDKILNTSPGTTNFLDYWQIKGNVFLFQEQRKIPCRICSFFCWRKTKEGEMGPPQKRQGNVYLILKWRNEHGVTTNCARQFRECIQFGIQFKVFWSSRKLPKWTYQSFRYTHWETSFPSLASAETEALFFWP